MEHINYAKGQDKKKIVCKRGFCSLYLYTITYNIEMENLIDYTDKNFQ